MFSMNLMYNYVALNSDIDLDILPYVWNMFILPNKCSELSLLKEASTILFREKSNGFQ